VIPAYNEERRIPGALEDLARYLEAHPLDLEVLVVDDGSIDRTAGRAEEMGRQLGLPLRVLRLPANRGKGAAVRAGVLAASGASVLVSDADFSTPIGEWEKLAATGAAVAIGSRALDDSLVKLRQPFFRQLSGKLFNRLVRLLAVPGIQDTQCGFKLFSTQAGRAVFERTKVDRFAFDVEALLIARHLGYRIVEVPVLWFNSDDSRVSLLGGLHAFLDLFRIAVSTRRRLRANP
jgi:dolichyl-phosphate beta-glucosyltransferase